MSGKNLITLDYEGNAIHLAGDMLSLTDMWRAAGADPARQPTEWLRSADARRFIDFLCESLNMGISQVYQTTRGKHGGGTLAHWQIGLAYAKYLSPQFHGWANGVVRERMEGKVVEASVLQRQVDRLRGEVEAIAGMLPELVAAVRQVVSGYDRRITATDMETMKEILNREGYRKRKPGTVQHASARCWRWMAEAGLHDKRNHSSETGIRIFNVDTARAWLKAEGAALIAANRKKVEGQTVLPFVFKPRD